MIKGEASITAKVCAFARAHHLAYAQNPVCIDSYASALLGEEYDFIKKGIMHILSSRCWEIPTYETWDAFIDELISPIILARMKYAEDELENFIGNTQQPVQYVVCGAGLDSFLFANSNPKLQIYELDHPDTQQYKLERIAQLGWGIPENVHFVSINFEQQKMDTVLKAAGFCPSHRSIFSVLGVTYYLSLETFCRTLEQIGALCENEAQVVFDYPSGNTDPRMDVIKDLAGAMGEKMQGGFEHKALTEQLHYNGFTIQKHMSPLEIQEEYFKKRNNTLRAYTDVYFMTTQKKRTEFNERTNGG